MDSYFCIIIWKPVCQLVFLKNSVDTQNYENREVTEMPKISLEEYAQFPQQYETYFNDNIPWRNQLISLNSGLDLFAFRDSSNENVLIGKDGWLFLQEGQIRWNSRQDNDFYRKMILKNCRTVDACTALGTEQGREIYFLSCTEQRDNLPGKAAGIRNSCYRRNRGVSADKLFERTYGYFGCLAV